MGLVAISSRRRAQEEARFLHNGMKPFFLLGAAYSAVSMVCWMAMYTFNVYPNDLSISPSQWHAHEVVYGFTLAVIAGFLLAALPEWTSVSTVSGRRLGGLVVLWLVPRILLLRGTSLLWIAASCDIIFSCALIVAVAHPIVASRSWRQSGILAKVVLLGAGNICFYLGAFQLFPYGLYLSSYGGLYLIVSLILTVGGRMLPGFIQNALERSAPITTPKWLTVLSMALFVGFFILELVSPDTSIARYLAIGLGVLISIRLFRWHAPGIWSRPLLWGLYLSFVSIAAGFFLFGTIECTGTSKTLALHAFTVGGIGMATLAMMVRAALGHYGGDVRNPPRLTAIALTALALAELCRVVVPLIFPARYGLMIAVSQVGWVVAYLLLTKILLSVFMRKQGKA